MTNEQWERLKALFHAALECDASARERFLDEHCASDPVLRQQLADMLASHEQVPDFMEAPAAAGMSWSATASASSHDLNDAAPLKPGDLLDGKYRVEQSIGAGGMGVVYKVLHTGLGRVFAAKVIQGAVSRDSRFLNRFRIEAEALGGLLHPNIVNVTDFGVDRERDLPYLITEYLDGETLADRLRTTGPLSVDVALPLFEAMSTAIDHAHAQGILHLDLKPGNVFLGRVGGGAEQVKILDFGLAHVIRGNSVGDDHSRTGEPLNGAARQIENPAVRPGTPAYMAPELAQGKAPLRSSDIYAFGVLAYEVLTGKTPFDGTAAEIFRSHLTEAPTAPSRVHALLPPELDASLLAPLEKHPEARLASAADLVAGIREASAVAALRRWRRDEVPRRVAWATGIALLSLLIFLWLSRTSVIEAFEGQSLDARFMSLPERPPDPRILLLVIDDESLQEDSTPLGAQGDRFGVALQRVFGAGARGIAIDLLLPEAWARSEGFSELVLRHANSLTLAAFSTMGGAVVGPESVAGAITAALGAERAAALFGFVNTSADRDGVHRRSRLSYADEDGRQRPSWAAQAASVFGALPADGFWPTLVFGRQNPGGGTFWIDRSVDWTTLERVSWKDVPRELSARPDRFRDRIVLVGATYAGSGDELTLSTLPRVDVPGLVLNALAVDSILSGFRLRDVRGWPVLVGIALATVAVGAVILCTARISLAALLTFCVFLAHGAVALLLFVRTQTVLPIAGPIVTIGAAAVLAMILRFVLPRIPSGHTPPRNRELWRRVDDRSLLEPSG